MNTQQTIFESIAKLTKTFRNILSKQKIKQFNIESNELNEERYSFQINLDHMLFRYQNNMNSELMYSFSHKELFYNQKKIPDIFIMEFLGILRDIMEQIQQKKVKISITHT